MGAAREMVVHRGSVFEVTDAGFLNVLFVLRVNASGFARDEFLGLARRDAEIEDKRFVRKIVNVVFEMLDPVDEGGASGFGDASGLMGEIGADVAVGEYDFSGVESGVEAEFGFEAITGVKERAEMRVNGFERAKIAVEKLADHFAEPGGFVLRKASGKDGMACRGESFFEESDLSAFAAAVDAFDGDEFSGRRHVRRSV